MTIRVCVECQYLVLVPGMDRGECRRWPKAEMKDANSWCGEFAAKVTAAGIAAIVEPAPKSKRLRESRAPATVGYDANGSPTE